MDNNAKKNIKGWKRFILNEYSLTIIICSSIFIFAQFLHVVRVSGMSMFPTYTPNELVRTTTDTSSINIDDVVVFNVTSEQLKGSPAGKDGKNHKLIKRVVGVEGDVIQIKNGELYRNNQRVPEKFDKMNNAGLAKEPVIIKEGEIFVLGDNRNDSYDSRKIGSIKIKDVTNIVKGKLLSFFTDKK
jgi:signal peptidase I, bacterial type